MLLKYSKVHACSVCLLCININNIKIVYFNINKVYINNINISYINKAPIFGAFFNKLQLNIIEYN